MALPDRVRTYLEENGAQFEVVRHPPTFSAQELAHVDHVPERTVAKTVIFLGDDVYAFAVLPADERIDLPQLRYVIGIDDIRIAEEHELLKLFPDCELGTAPPFGPLFNLPVYVDQRLTEQDRIELNGGTHRDELRMSYDEFARLAQPIVVDFGVPK